MRYPIPLFLLSLLLLATSAKALEAIVEAEPGLTYPISIYIGKVQQGHRAYKAGDYERAFDEYNKTARWGEKDCQFKLATLYIEGKGTAPDAVQGYAWLKTAAESKNRTMLELLERLTEVMTEQQLADGEALAAEYIEQYGMKARNIRCERRAATGTNKKFLDCRKRYMY